MKVCTKCRLEKPFSGFTKTKATKDGYHSNCKECRSKTKKLHRGLNHESILEREAAYRELKREHLRAYHKSWRGANPESVVSHRQQWLNKNPEYQREHYLLLGRKTYLEKTYGLTETDYKEMLESQGGVCAICNTHYDYHLHVDHDHSTGDIRGLLCKDCNLGLGHFKDDSGRLYNAMKYLKGSKNGN